MGDGPSSSASTTYNDYKTVTAHNTLNEANQVTTNESMFRDTSNIQNGIFKVQVAGNVGKNARIELLNLDDITQVQLPNG